mmetsp:Transcript_2375/g.7204  ORF Transcript_2375/g.7204 Transcript_2375/m.7204 type:complete len:212 (-) Transcript_2375:57-692(-)
MRCRVAPALGWRDSPFSTIASETLRSSLSAALRRAASCRKGSTCTCTRTSTRPRGETRSRRPSRATPTSCRPTSAGRLPSLATSCGATRPQPRRHRSPARRPSASPTRRRLLGWRPLTRIETCCLGGCGQRHPPPRRSRSWSRRPARRPPPRTLSRRTSRPRRGSCPVTFSSGCWRCETDAKRLHNAHDNRQGSGPSDISRLNAVCSGSGM